MREAGCISAEAHCLAMKASAEGVTEYQLGAEILYHFAKMVLVNQRSICYWAGDNASWSFHESGVLQNDELVLIDAGLNCKVMPQILPVPFLQMVSFWTTKRFTNCSWCTRSCNCRVCTEQYVWRCKASVFKHVSEWFGGIGYSSRWCRHFDKRRSI